MVKAAQPDSCAIDELTADPKNARKHGSRNVGMIADALREVGAGRSIVIDEEGVVLAGNATIEAARDAGIERVQVVEADGSTLVAVRRRGLSDAQKKRLALFDNRAAELGEWDAGVVAGFAEEELPLGDLFRDDELEELLEQARISEVMQSGFDVVSGSGGHIGKLGETKKQVKPVLYVEQLAVLERAIQQTGLRNRGEALVAICQAYLGDDAEGQFDPSA